MTLSPTTLTSNNTKDNSLNENNPDIPITPTLPLHYSGGNINIRGFHRRYKRYLVADAINRRNLDFLFVTETWMTTREFRTLNFLREDSKSKRPVELLPNYRLYHSAEDEDNLGKGVGLIIKNNLAKHVQEIWDIPGRVILIRLAFYQHQMVLGGVQLPTGGDSPETRSISQKQKEHLKKWKKKSTILMGDFNACLNPSLDRLVIRNNVRISKSSTRPESTIVRLLTSQWGWKCPWRELSPTKRLYSFEQRMHNEVRHSRLDYILTSPNANFQLFDIEYETDFKIFESDHNAIFTKIALIPYYEIPTPDKLNYLPKKVNWEKFQSMMEKAHIFNNRLSAGIWTPPFNEACRIQALLEEEIRSCAQLLAPKHRGSSRQSKNFLPVELQAVKLILKAKKARELHSLVPRLTRKFKMLEKYFSCTIESEKDIKRLIYLLRSVCEERLRKQHLEKMKEHIKSRLENFRGNLKYNLNMILDKRVEVTRVDRAWCEDTFVTDPAGVKEAVANYFVSWLPPPGKLDVPPDWNGVYQPKINIPEEIYETLLHPVLPEQIVSTVKKFNGYKAPGLSGVHISYYQNLPSQGYTVLAQNFTTFLKENDIPDWWKCSIITPIPKPNPWNGDLTQLQPIVLIESSRKIFSKILIERLQKIITDNDILHGRNVGFTKGLEMTDFVYVFKYLVVIAKIEGSNFEALLLDIQKAYDSVTLESLVLSMKRIRIPAGYINLVENIFRGRTSQVLTKFRLTRKFRPERGLDQGEISSPLLWTIFYDPLLEALSQHNNQLYLTFDDEVVNCNYGAGADDLTLIASSRDNLQTLADKVTAFLDMHSIKVNVKKTEHVVLDIPTSTTWDDRRIVLQNHAVEIIRDQDYSFRLLGVYMSLRSDGKQLTKYLMGQVTEFMDTINNKVINKEIFGYLTRAVLFPRLLYRLNATDIPFNLLKSIDRAWVVRGKRFWGLPRSCPPDIIQTHPRHAIPSLVESLASQMLRTYNKLLNSNHRYGKLIRISFLTLCRHFNIQDLQQFGSDQGSKRTKTHFNWLNNFCNNLRWRIVPGSNDVTLPFSQHRVPIGCNLNLKYWWRKYARSLIKDKIIYLDDVIQPDGNIVDGLEEKGRSRKWLPALVELLHTVNISAHDTNYTINPENTHHELPWTHTTFWDIRKFNIPEECIQRGSHTAAMSVTLTSSKGGIYEAVLPGVRLHIKCNATESAILSLAYLLLNGARGKRDLTLNIKSTISTRLPKLWNKQDPYRNIVWFEMSCGGLYYTIKDALTLAQQTLNIRIMKYQEESTPVQNQYYWDIQDLDSTGWRLVVKKDQIPLNRQTLNQCLFIPEKQSRLYKLWRKTPMPAIPRPNDIFLDSPVDPNKDLYQAFHLKLLYRQLPTAKRLNQIDPQKYPEDICPTCTLCTEDQRHWMNCPFWEYLRRLISDKI